MFPRLIDKDIILKDIPIKKGTGVMIQPLSNQYSEKYFKNPTVFKPERWMSECDDLPQFVMGGFGGGMRTCIGKHLAML